jgi:hypothetical protein
MSVLTADSLEGRETAEPGQKKAANYIRDHFNRIGLLPVQIDGKDTYDQVFPIENRRTQEVSLTFGDQLFFHSSDFIHGGRFDRTTQDTVRIAFAGNGTPEDLGKVRPEGEAVLFIHSRTGFSLSEKINFCRDKGFNYIFIIYGEQDQEFEQLLEASNMYIPGIWAQDQREDAQLFFIPPSLGSDIFKTDMDHLLKTVEKSQKGKRKPFRKIADTSMIVQAEAQDSLVYTENILGYIKGAEKPDECVIISAHYDHVGMREGDIYRGADDNASGTASLMELAEAFCLARGKGFHPLRSILFITFTGEEKGLLGSDYYVNHPIFPLSKTVADLNIDMIGRSDRQHSADTGYVYLIGSDKLSMELHEISERMNLEHTNLMLDYTYNDDADPNRYYFRSDQYNFAKNNIPVIFYFTGVHEDYHKPTDTLEKIRFDNMMTISKLIFYTAWDIVTREERLNLK